MAGRKRVYAGPPRSGGSKRMKRTFRKRRRFARGSNSRKVINFTSESASGSGIGFKNKKLRRSRYNNMLWNATMFKKHWRSVFSASSGFSSPANAALMAVEISTALRLGANNFWLTAGGAINPDGGAVGTFPSDDDFIIRGGKIGLRICNQADVLGTTPETLQVWVYLIRTSSGYNPGALAASYPIGWDPTNITDFQTLLGRIVYRKQFLLKDGEVTDIEYRLKMQKVDASDYVAGRNTYVWMYMVSNTDSASSRTLTISPYYNLSFSADQI